MVLWLYGETGASASILGPRAGISAGWLTAGPLEITGPLREALTPHASSAGSPAWAESGSAELDTALEPPRRYGVVIAPLGMPLEWLAARTSEGVVSAASIGFAGRSAEDQDPVGADAMALVALPESQPDPDPPGVPWFDRSPAPAGTAHLLLRAFCRDPVGRSFRAGIATALSLLQTAPPGTWWRLGLDASVVGPSAATSASGPMCDNDRELRVRTLLALTSPAYRTPYSGPPGEALSVCLRVEADYADLLGATVNARTSASWRPAAMLPESPFTMRGLARDETEVELIGRVSAGAWSSRGSLIIAGRLPKLGAAIRYQSDPVSLEGTAKLEIGDRETEATIGLELDLDPVAAADHPRVRPMLHQDPEFGISASFRATPWEDGYGSGVAAVRFAAGVGDAEVFLRGEAEWDAADNNGVSFEAELGFSIATAPE